MAAMRQSGMPLPGGNVQLMMKPTLKDLSAAGADASAPELVIDSQDRATVVWVRSDDTNDRIQAVRLEADGTPGTIHDLSAAGKDASGPQLAIDSEDRTTVVWLRSDGTNSRVQSVRLNAGGMPGDVQDSIGGR